MKIGKILKISISAILSLAVLASMLIIPAVSAETVADAAAAASAEYGMTFEGYTNTFSTYYSFQNDAAPTVWNGENGLPADYNLKFENQPADAANNNPYSFFTIKIPNLTVGEAYDFSYYVYSADDSVKVNLREAYAATKYAGESFASFGTRPHQDKAISDIDSDGLFPLRTVFIATAETMYWLIGLKNTTTSKGVVYFDDFSVKKVVNYIGNGSFENGTEGWNRANTNDFVSVKAADEGLTVVDGTNVLKGNVTTTDWSYINQSGTVKPNTKYKLSISYMIPEGGRLFYKGGTKSTENAYFEQATITTATNGWKTAAHTFTTSATDSSFKMAIQLRAAGTKAVYVDNLLLLEEKTITATAQEGGTVSAATTKAFYGDSVTLTATPNKGYLFDGWYNGDTLVSTATPYTFTVAGNTALTAKFIADDATNLVVNGSFEGALVSGWNATAYPDFTSVKAADKGISAVDGERVLDVTKAASWNWNYTYQNIAVEKDKTYRVSFWVYKTATANNAMYKLGTSTNEKEYVSDRYFNYGEYVNAGKWLYVSHTINSTDTTLKMALVSHTGTVYIDDIRVVEADSIGNLVENGDMSNAAKAVNVWSIGSSSIFAYDAETEGYTGTGALKVTGSSSASWANAKYTFSVKANTDYVFRFYAKNAVAGKKSVYKILGADNKTYMFNGKDAYTNGDGANGDGADWGKNEWRFNSGENTTLYLYFVELDNVTYIDDIYLGEAIEATCASSNKALGTVSASKAYVGEDDEVAYTATATAGGKFLGWRVGDSDTLVEGETYTYKGFDDITITAVFEAALGNVNEDGAIDAADMAALRESILGSAEYTALGDMNANAANDIRDLVALYQTISK